MFNKNRFSGRRFHPMKIVFFILAAAAYILVFGAIVMYLWNWIVPDLTGFKPISYIKAIGLLLLFKVLFGGFGGRNRAARRKHWKSKWNSKWRSKWKEMSPEERAAFKAKWRERCGKDNDKA